MNLDQIRSDQSMQSKDEMNSGVYKVPIGAV